MRKLICKWFNRHEWKRVTFRFSTMDKCIHCGKHRTVTIGVPQ